MEHTSALREPLVAAAQVRSLPADMTAIIAADATLALQAARDLYTRRQEGVSIWVVPSAQITASSPEEKDEFFEPAADKIFRDPPFFKLPAEVGHI